MKKNFLTLLFTIFCAQLSQAASSIPYYAPYPSEVTEKFKQCGREVVGYVLAKPSGETIYEGRFPLHMVIGMDEMSKSSGVSPAEATKPATEKAIATAQARVGVPYYVSLPSDFYESLLGSIYGKGVSEGAFQEMGGRIISSEAFVQISQYQQIKTLIPTLSQLEIQGMIGPMNNFSSILVPAAEQKGGGKKPGKKAKPRHHDGWGGGWGEHHNPFAKAF